MVSWRFLSNHGRALLCIANDPGARLRDVGADLGITDRRAYGIVTDLVDSGYVIKTKDGRRNQYRVRVDLPLPDPSTTGRTIGEVLELLAGTDNSNELCLSPPGGTVDLFEAEPNTLPDLTRDSDGAR